MKNFNDALEMELKKMYVGATKLYERELEDNPKPSIDTFINLAFLYWEFAAEQIEFNYPNNIPDKWSDIGEERHLRIIELGLQKYPRNAELHFWKKYFPHRLVYDDFTQYECEQIIKAYGDSESLVPYFFLYLFDKPKYKEQRDALRKQCERVATAKNLYILGFN